MAFDVCNVVFLYVTNELFFFFNFFVRYSFGMYYYWYVIQFQFFGQVRIAELNEYQASIMLVFEI